MKLFWKIFFITLILSLLFVAGFETWGAFFEKLLDQNQCSAWFAASRSYAWLIGIGFLIGDLLLPIPATGIMAALGSVYGFWLGGLISITGSAGAGMTGYLLARFLGRRATRFLATDRELDQFQIFFNSWGGAAIIVSRVLPILPEVISILAGLARMNLARFSAALLLGTVPTCLLFSYLGAKSQSAPLSSIFIASILPLALWPVFLKFFLPQPTPTQ